MGRPDYIFGKFRETVRCRDAQHGDGVCCALALQLVNLFCQSVEQWTGVVYFDWRFEPLGHLLLHGHVVII